MPIRFNQNGFTLVEIILVMAVMSLLLGALIPNMRGTLQDAQLDKVDGELATIKTAIVHYWRNNNFAYPPDIRTSLTTAVPDVLPHVLADPFQTDTSATPNTYGYLLGTDPAFGTYFIVYSRGPRGDTTAPAWDSATNRVTYTGSGRVTSNAGVVHQ